MRIKWTDYKNTLVEKNELIFYVYFNSNKKIKANINLLPLKDDCYSKLKSGLMLDKEISADDIFTTHEKELVNYIYCEGLNIVDDIYLRNIGSEFKNMIENISNVKRRIIIGAFGGTIEGDRLMEEKLGFNIVSVGVNGKEEYKFYEIEYSMLLDKINSFFVVKNTIL